ncbi:MAG: DNA mismatch repair protein MutS [Dehalococcoidia bacterium]
MTTPLRRQYLEIKRRFPQAIVFFRLGDFYETFDQDAELVARELEIVLTSRPIGKGQRVPLAGIPHHALDGYLAKLIAKGHKVAICEQVSEAASAAKGSAPSGLSPSGRSLSLPKGRGLMERQVVRVVTPGTVIEGELLDQRANNYLAALVVEGDRAGLAYVDVSTGEFAVAQMDADLLPAELDRLRPAELVLPKGQQPLEGIQVAVSHLETHRFDPETASELLLAHFGAASLDAFGCADQPLAVAAAGAILAYLQDNQRAVLGHITRLSTYNTTAFMTLDSQTRRNLELVASIRQGPGSASLLSVIDLTKTTIGARLLRRWLGQPLLDITHIQRRQERVQFFLQSAVRRGQVSALLAKMPDLERLLGRISAGLASPREVVSLRRGLELVPALRQAIAADGEETAEAAELLGRLHPCQETAALIAQAIEDDPAAGFEEGGVIRPGFSPELDSLRSVARDARQYLAELERRERQQTGIKSLKVGYNKVFGYYIEVSKANLRLVPAHYQRRQTLVGGERFTTPELKEREFQILHARERQEELERTLFRQVCAQIAAEGKRILELAAAVAETDVFCALAEVAARYGYVRPEVTEDDAIVIRDGRHPVVERMLPQGTFVPNDSHLSNRDAQIIILTGPNMAGKSTYIRQVALIVLLAQIGSFVPAASARIGIVDRIFTRVGALDDIAAGQSTFLVEMLETASILHNATPRSLLLFDEIGRGTSTYDGMAIARAVVEFLHNRPEVAAKTLFATHYHELIDLAAFLPRVKNYNVAVSEEEGRVVFLHRILPGGADRSYGVHVAQLAGLPRPVVQRAQEVLSELEDKRDRLPTRRRPREAAVQLPLLGANQALVEELASLDVDSLTPLQAITKLFELREKARKNDA